jgi:transposase InsO family protein
MTCLNPHAHYIHVTSSQRWEWIAGTRPPRTFSSAAKKRYRWLRWHAQHGQNVSLTCRHHGISRATFYRWQHRVERQGLAGLEDRSHRPHHCRHHAWTPEDEAAVLRLRTQYPRWGKAKLQVLLAREGRVLSCSMVGRILTQLKRTGRVREPRQRTKRYGVRPLRPHAIRKPKDYVVAAPGDLVQVDTLDVRPVVDKGFKQLSLVDVLSRYAVAEIGSSASASLITTHLQRMLARLPFRVRAIQVDGGSEFKAEFEAYCQQHGLQLFTLPPRSPKLNGCVERLQRTFGEECYQCAEVAPRVADLAAVLHDFEDVYNHIRPHTALGYRTPAEELARLEASA